MEAASGSSDPQRLLFLNRWQQSYLLVFVSMLFKTSARAFDRAPCPVPR
jgi:hypothetical protein